MVIGILIALQINNWNEERKNKIEQDILMTNLKIEFERKLLELKDKNEGRKVNIQGINKVLNVISGHNPAMDARELIQIMGGLQSYYEVNEEFSIIEMLFNSGKINTISNDSLKSALISWPDKLEEMFEEQRIVKDVVVHQLSPLLNTYVPQRNLNIYYEIDKVDEVPHEPSPYENDFDELLRNRSFENLISTKKLFLIHNYNDTQELIFAAEHILELLNQELEND